MPDSIIGYNLDVSLSERVAGTNELVQETVIWKQSFSIKSDRVRNDIDSITNSIRVKFAELLHNYNEQLKAQFDESEKDLSLAREERNIELSYKIESETRNQFLQYRNKILELVHEFIKIKTTEISIIEQNINANVHEESEEIIQNITVHRDQLYQFENGKLFITDTENANIVLKELNNLESLMFSERKGIIYTLLSFIENGKSSLHKHEIDFEKNISALYSEYLQHFERLYKGTVTSIIDIEDKERDEQRIARQKIIMERVSLSKKLREEEDRLNENISEAEYRAKQQILNIAKDFSNKKEELSSGYRKVSNHQLIDKLIDEMENKRAELQEEQNYLLQQEKRKLTEAFLQIDKKREMLESQKGEIEYLSLEISRHQQLLDRGKLSDEAIKTHQDLAILFDKASAKQKEMEQNVEKLSNTIESTIHDSMEAGREKLQSKMEIVEKEFQDRIVSLQENTQLDREKFDESKKQLEESKNKQLLHINELLREQEDMYAQKRQKLREKLQNNINKIT